MLIAEVFQAALLVISKLPGRDKKGSLWFICVKVKTQTWARAFSKSGCVGVLYPRQRKVAPASCLGEQISEDFYSFPGKLQLKGKVSGRSQISVWICQVSWLLHLTHWGLFWIRIGCTFPVAGLQLQRGSILALTSFIPCNNPFQLPTAVHRF